MGANHGAFACLFSEGSSWLSKEASGEIVMSGRTLGLREVLCLGADTSSRQIYLVCGFHPEDRHESCNLQPSFDKACMGSQRASKMVLKPFFRHFSI